MVVRSSRSETHEIDRIEIASALGRQKGCLRVFELQVDSGTFLLFFLAVSVALFCCAFA